MAVLFVSHSSRDDAAGASLEAWLRRRGFTDVFIDHNNILGGEKWAQALRDAAGACRVIICLVTDNWLASDECFGEFKAAWYMGKPVIPLLALTSSHALQSERLAKVLAEYQGLDLTGCVGNDGELDLAKDAQVERRLEGGLRAAGALTRIGLDPEAFPINRKIRPTPFPGLASFSDDDADAALFYGRSREIAEVLEELRKMRAEGDRRPLAILGSSGAGKSSLLKAGIIPRLRREAPAWLPLRAFRPGADPLLNFAEALARTSADSAKSEAYGVVRDRLFKVWSDAERHGVQLTADGNKRLLKALEEEGAKMRRLADRPGATILVGIDQAEELARADGPSNEALADYLRVLLTSNASSWQVALTIRTDSFPELQRHRHFRDVKMRGYDLRALPAFRFADVIEAPASRYGVTIESGLADALLEDTPKDDALPLLAFALQRLWRLYGDSGMLTQVHYQNVGRLTGLIENAAECALRGMHPENDAPIPGATLSDDVVSLCRSTFVPGLAQVNDQGATIRCVAQWSSLTQEQQELLHHFVQWRLLVRRGADAEGGTVEVAHEALFREWARLKSWLEPERARLEVLRSLQSAALIWHRNQRSAAFLDHRGQRLNETRSLTRDVRYKKRLGKLDYDYLDACRGAELRRRLTQLGAASFACLALGLGYVALADDGISLPGADTLRVYMDHFGLSVFRPVHDVGTMLQSAQAGAGRMIEKLNGELAARKWMVKNQSRAIPTPTPSVWLTTQAITARFHSSAVDELSAVDYIGALNDLFQQNLLVEQHGTKFGWLRDDNSYPIAEPAFWAIAALSTVSASGHLDDETRKRLLQELDYTQSVADLYRPINDGGWNTFAQQNSPDRHSVYTSTLALLALLEVRDAGLAWHGDKLQVDTLLRSTAAWLNSQFDTTGPLLGWRVHLNDASNSNNGPVSDGLTLQIYSELLRAEDEASVAIPEEILLAIPRHLNSLVGRRSDYPIIAGTNWQDFTNFDGKFMTQNITENFLWYPWAIECAVQWLRRLQRVHGSPEALRQADRVLGYLLVDLGAEKLTPASVAHDSTFVSSEQLYGVGTALSYLSSAVAGRPK